MSLCQKTKYAFMSKTNMSLCQNAVNGPPPRYLNLIFRHILMYE